MRTSMAVLLLAVSLAGAQEEKEAKRQLELMQADSLALQETARKIAEIPVEASGALIPAFPTPSAELTDPTAEQIEALLAQREAYWKERKAVIASDTYEFRASTGMAEAETKLVEAILADVAADRAAVAGGSFGQPLIDRKAKLLIGWLDFLKFKRGCLLGLEPLNPSPAPLKPKTPWYKPTAVQGLGGVQQRKVWDQFHPGSYVGGGVYVSFQPFQNKWLRPLTVQPGLGVWQKQVSDEWRTSVHIDRSEDEPVDVTIDEQTRATTTDRFLDFGKIVYAPTLGRFTPYVGAGLYRGTSVYKADVAWDVSGAPVQPSHREFEVKGKGTAVTGLYWTAGLGVAVSRAWTVLGDFSWSWELGRRASIGVKYALKDKR